MNGLIQVARNASPYLAIELLLPGGTLIALLLWLFRDRCKKGTWRRAIERLSLRGDSKKSEARAGATL